MRVHLRARKNNSQHPPFTQSTAVVFYSTCIVLTNADLVQHFPFIIYFFAVLSEPSLALSPAVSELLPRMKTNKHVNALHFFFPLMICFCLGHSNVKRIIGGWMLKCEGRG